MPGIVRNSSPGSEYQLRVELCGFHLNLQVVSGSCTTGKSKRIRFKRVQQGGGGGGGGEGGGGARSEVCVCVCGGGGGGLNANV